MTKTSKIAEKSRTVPLNVRIPEALDDALDAHRDAAGVSKATIVKLAIGRYLEDASGRPAATSARAEIDEAVEAIDGAFAAAAKIGNILKRIR